MRNLLQPFPSTVYKTWEYRDIRCPRTGTVETWWQDAWLFAWAWIGQLMVLDAIGGHGHRITTVLEHKGGRWARWFLRDGEPVALLFIP